MRDQDELVLVALQVGVAAEHLNDVRLPDGGHGVARPDQRALARAGDYLSATHEAMRDVFDDQAGRPALVAHDLERVGRLCQMVDELLGECARHLWTERHFSAGDQADSVDASLHALDRARIAVQSAARLALRLEAAGREPVGTTSAMTAPATARLRAAQRDGHPGAVAALHTGPRR